MTFDPIAIVGQSCIFPRSFHPSELWSHILQGRDLVQSCPDNRWRVAKEHALSPPEHRRPDTAVTDRGGYVEGFAKHFNPSGFRISAKDILSLDEQFQWVLHGGREALRDARLENAPPRTGAVIGLLGLPTGKLIQFAEAVWVGSPRPDARNRFSTGLPAQILAHALGLDAGAFALDAACASSLVAMKLACDALHEGTSDRMLAGAVSCADPLYIQVGFSALGAVSPTGQSRPFHRSADGLLPAEGASFVVLKRLADAVRDGDRIDGVIRGIGMGNDGRGAGLMAPSAEGQFAAMRIAYRAAGLEPAQISIVECHATGTPVGDDCELRSTGRIFEGCNSVPIGSVKSNMGHAMTAAGMAGLLKILAGMKDGVRAASLHAAAATDQIARLRESPFRLLTQNEAWNGHAVRRAALSAFGFGGNNAHLIVEQWTGVEPRRTLPRVSPSPALAVVAVASVRPPGGLLEAIALELEGLGFPPADLAQSSPAHALTLALAAEAISQCSPLPQRTGVLCSTGIYPEIVRLSLRAVKRLPDEDRLRTLSPPLTGAAVIGRLCNIEANRVSSRYDLRGFSFAVFSEGDDGRQALKLACAALCRGETDAMVVASCAIENDRIHKAASAELNGAVARCEQDSGWCLILKRLTDAEAAGDRVLGLIEGDAMPADVLKSAAAAVAVKAPRVYTWSANDPYALAEAVRTNRVGGENPLRLAIVASDREQFEARRARAIEALLAGSTSLNAVGVYLRGVFGQCQVAFVFPGAAAALQGAGRSLIQTFPETLTNVCARAPGFAAGASWLFEPRDRRADPVEKLWATTVITQCHAHLTRRMLNVQADAAIGMSSGETNALFAFDVWRDGDAFAAELHDAGLFTRQLGGELQVLDGSGWEVWLFTITPQEMEQLRHACEGLRVLAIHAPGEYLVAGVAAVFECALRRVPAGQAQRVDFDLVVHAPEAAPFAGEWRQLHRRETFAPPAGVRFYQMAEARVFEVNSDSVADSLTAQVLTTLDFPRLVEQAWQDGIRVFLEHGPRGACTSWIRRILGKREHMAIPLDMAGVDSLTQAANAVAQLFVCGAKVDLEVFNRRAVPEEGQSRHTVSIPAHFPDIDPAMLQPKPRRTLSPAPSPALFASHASRVVEEFSYYLEMAGSASHQSFLRASTAAFRAAVGAPYTAASPPAPVPVPATKFDRADLEVTASGRISSIFGEQFAPLDAYRRIVRLPMPPMLLADRIVSIDAVPGSMKTGSLIAETDIVHDAWYMHADRMSASIVIESGQADMLLISWLGIDFLVQGERSYRLLGCDLTWNSELPAAGQTLRYNIRVTGHAQQGDVRLFFFEYDCHAGDRLVASVRNGQAGFFTDEELRASTGILWRPQPARAVVDAHVPRFPALPLSYSQELVRAAAAGDCYTCFGSGFELSAAQQRPPSLSNQKLLMIDRIAELDFNGGPFKRGYLRAEYDLTPDHWVFECHFKDDPCFPGTLMLEGALQGMGFYMMALGFTLERDAWRFEPLPGQQYPLRCRGQATPESRLMVCEVFVEEVVDGDEPVLYAQVVGSVDGLKCFACTGMALRLTAGNPLDNAPTPAKESKAVAVVNGIRLDYAALIACANGLPSHAFGEPYARFDRHRRCPRLPSPPYHLLHRIVNIDGEFGDSARGTAIVAECDLTPAQWYFTDASSRELTFAALMEIGLQPCGWISCFTGVPLRSEEDLYFRNLDGSAKILASIPPGECIVTTSAVLTNIASSGPITLTSFQVTVSLGPTAVLQMQTTFGFFRRQELMGQAGLLVTGDERGRLEEPSSISIDLTERRSYRRTEGLHLPQGDLLMIDRITGIWTDRIRAEKNIDPSEWFFKAHFYGDPVQPGSLGVEAILQTAQFYAIHMGLGETIANPEFEMKGDIVWKYRGQVVPASRKVITEVFIRHVEKSSRHVDVRAEGLLWVDGLKIYHVAQFGIRIREARG